MAIIDISERGRRLAVALAVATVALLGARGAVAAPVTAITSADCPYTISAPGAYRLDGDCDDEGTGTAITIDANNVTLDLNGK